jgi:ATPase subunit of ABC transporter with duplicated ATPase domains
MSASITTLDLGWSTPAGHAVLSDISLGFAPERTGIVGRNGTGKTTLLRLLAGTLSPTTGRVTRTGSVAVLRQMLHITPGATIADLFGVTDAFAVLRRADAGTATMEELAEADWTLDARVAAALEQVGLAATPDTHLSALSGGQRTRAAMAAAMLAAPDFLLLDEPTNNLDAEGRAALFALIDGWGGGAIVVSHDRALLERMDAILELTALGATRYGGNWSAYRARKAIELAAARHDLDVAERQVAGIARRSQVAAERKQRRDSGGRREAARGGMPRILLGARRERAENSGGEGVRLAERLRAEAAEAARSARARVEILEPLTVQLEPTGLAANRVVLTLDRVTAGHDRAHPCIRDLSLTVTGPERIAIEGPNGSGKTTLLRVIVGELAPLSGRVTRGVPMAMLDQSVALLDPALSIAENFRALHPGTDEQACRAALARFRFRADAALQVAGSLSGGQMLRAGLACVLGGAAPPPLLIMDEPTNHLDLDSIAAVEAGLLAYDGALLVVSHDAAFLETIGMTRRVAL